MPTSIELYNCILSFPNLYTPRAAKGSNTPKYSAQIILPQNADWGAINAAIAEATTNKWGANPPANLKSQIKQVAEGPYAGYWAISANSNADNPPDVVDQNVERLLDQRMIFAGCIVNVHINFYGYDTGSNGIGAGLNIVMLVDNINVTRLDNTKTAKDVFQAMPNANVQAAPGHLPNQPAAAPMQQPAAPAQQAPIQQQPGQIPQQSVQPGATVVNNPAPVAAPQQAPMQQQPVAPTAAPQQAPMQQQPVAPAAAPQQAPMQQQGPLA